MFTTHLQIFITKSEYGIVNKFYVIRKVMENEIFDINIKLLLKLNRILYKLKCTKIIYY